MASIPDRNKKWLLERSYIWEPNPELRYVWVSSASQIVDKVFHETLDDVISLVQKLPVMYTVDESFIQEVDDRDPVIHQPGINTVSRDVLIEQLHKMKNSGNS